jgi:phosphatidylglycerophosphate synthase
VSRRPPLLAGQGAVAVLLATAPADDGTCAAALRVDGEPVVARLLGQLAALGVRGASVVTRPAWADAIAEAVTGASLPCEVVAAEGLAEDLDAIAQVAAAGRGTLLVAYADLVTQREALAGLVADPRIVSGILTGPPTVPGSWVFRTRNARGRIVSAASPYHRLLQGGAHSLGVIKADPRDRAALAAAARELAPLAARRPASWDDELARKAIDWRLEQWRLLQPEPAPGEARVDPDPAEWAELEVGADGEAEIAARLHAARQDALSLLLVGLVRTDVVLSSSHVREFFAARPRTAIDAVACEAQLVHHDEDRMALDSAVKRSDGFFTTFLVSPYSKYIARFCARRGLTPNQVTSFSMLLGAIAAACFAAGSRGGMIAGAIVLQAAFTFDCVDGQLARYSRQFSKLGAWLDSVFDRGKEYVVYVGLAIGASHGFGQDVWTLAAAALALQTARHFQDFSWAAGQRVVIAAAPLLPLDQAEDRPLGIDLPDSRASRRAAAVAVAAAPVAEPARPPLLSPAGARDAARRFVRLVGIVDRYGWARWAKRILVLPIGERFALISVTAAIGTPKLTFIALLVWGGIAALYSILGRIGRSVAR